MKSVNLNDLIDGMGLFDSLAPTTLAAICIDLTPQGIFGKWREMAYKALVVNVGEEEAAAMVKRAGSDA